MHNSPWIVAHNAVRNPQLRLFCFPYAGGGASTYRKWSPCLPTGVELLAAQMPGRETRLNEPPLRDMDLVVARLATAIEPLLDRPFAFFGHSLGALIAFELTRLLRSRGHRLPEHLVVSGRRAPNVPRERRALHDLPDNELIDEIRKMSGTSEAVLQNDELMALVLPTLRADFAVHDTYCYRQEAPLDVPISIFGGLDDIATTPENLSAWNAMTTREARLSLFRGGHFFIEDARGEVLAALERALLGVLRPRGDQSSARLAISNPG
ncbi:MAG: alpha/beta fold hydrolase [Pseudomonadota bacterium]|nr:alpha/beta fold hydrolase [Pseudomonadota bacterium]